MRKVKFATMILAASLLTACGSSKKEQSVNEETAAARTQETENLLANLKKIPSKGIMLGHHDDTVYGIGWEGEEGRSDVKNGEGPHPIKTPKGWLHLAHGVRGCAAGLRYVLYMYMTSLEDPTKLIATPGGAFMVPEGEERIGDVSNVLFTNGWIADEDGTVFIYYASSDTRMHVATSTIDKLVDYCMNTPADGLSSSASVETLKKLIGKNLQIMK